LSNTFKLVEERNFNSVYIEGDKKRYADLIKTAECFSNVQALFAMVASESVSENSLDNLLGKTNIPTDFDLLSIDIDSFDLDIWESLDNYNPKVVVIEVNSGIMPGILSRHNSLHDGNSFSSTLLVAERKTIR
jgi:hypothetical protein